MILGLERLDRITMFIDEVASMPLGGGRGLSGRLDSRELPHHAAIGAIASQRSNLGPQGSEEEQQRRRRQATAVEQMRNGPSGPVSVGGHSSMLALHVPPPPVSIRPPGSDSAFPLNPHQSYDEEWGTMAGGGGHDSDSDVFLTPHASAILPDPVFGCRTSPKSSPKQESPGTASQSGFASNQLPSKSSATTQSAAHLPLQSCRLQTDPPRSRLDLSSSASAPAGPPTGPPSTPERPHPSTSDKFYSPQHQQPQQLQQRSPSSLLSRASARIRVALEASEAATIKAGPADPPPRQPGLPPSSGHHRTHSQQVPNSVSRSGGMHRRTSSWQQLQPQQPPQLGAVSISDMAPEHSRGSESTLGGYMTARSDTASGLSEAGHSVATPLSNVQQHLRNFSAQSLSGFSDPGTPLSAAQDRADFLVNATAPHRGPHGFYREGHESPAHQTTGMAGSSDLSWSRLGQSPAGRQGSDPMTPVSPFAAVGQQAAVPAQWHTFDNQPQAMPPGQVRQQSAWAQQATGQGQHQQPWDQGQSMQQPPGQQLWGQRQGQLQQQPLWQGQWQQQACNQAQAQAQQQSWSQQGQGEPQQQVPWGHHQGPFHEATAAGQEQAQQQPLWSGQPQHQDSWPEGQNQGHSQTQHQPPWVQSQVQQPSQGQVHDQPSSVEPSRHSQGMQEPVGQLHGAPSGVPLEHRSRTMRTMSFRQVVRSASEGDAMAMQAQPATALQVMQAYERSPVPQPGEEFEFCPDPSLQPVHYLRGRSSQGLGAQYVHRAAVAAAEAEAGEGLSSWTIAALCRCLSLDNILLLLTGVLLEKQLVLFCPNIGLLSTCVLSLIPLLRPFTWQSLLLPVLPDNLLSFLEAPVPFVIGVQYKTSEVRSKCSGLMRVNIYKDQIKTSGPMPPLPNDKALYASLRPAYNVLKAAGQERRGGTPMYAISEEQKKAADTMLQALQDYLSSICSELQSYTITDVQTPDRVAVLLKDSYIESFQPRDRAFVRQFTETQMFSVYCDSVIR
ncbi:TPA: hypothetical protein ACH3X2_001256 [Trebouxia sp. C0005]